MLLAAFMIPAQLSLVPNFVVMIHLGWIGSLPSLIIPDELAEAARIDGPASSAPISRWPNR